MVCFFFNDTATTEIYTLSLHDALPIFAGSDCTYAESPSGSVHSFLPSEPRTAQTSSPFGMTTTPSAADRKSTRLNSSHANISYAVFCLKKKHPTACLLFARRSALRRLP